MKNISRQLQVHVMSHRELCELGPRDDLSRKLSGKAAFEIITTGGTKAVLQVERVSLLRKTKTRLAALAV